MIDSQLIQEASKGDRKAQATLYKYCFGKFMPVCYRYTNNEEFAREELNQGFTKIIFNLKTWLKKSENFDGWAATIIKNSLIDNYRKEKKHLYQEDISDVIVENKVEHVDSTNEKIGEDSVMELMKYVPEASRHVFNLYVVEGYGHKEIAELLSISEGTSKWHLSNARKILQDVIKKLNYTISIVVALLLGIQ